MAGTRAAASAALLVLLLLPAGCERPDPRPNVLFVLADDLRWDALGSYGNRQIRTPELDRLAREGLALDAFYVASPVCVASRISLLTGRYLSQQGVVRRPLARIEEGTATVAALFAEAGYRTAFVGKLHTASDPLELGFGEAPFYHVARRIGQGSYDPRLWGVREGGVGALRIEEVEGDPTTPTIDAAIDFVARQGREPWFLWLATTAPHYPYYRHPEYAYDAEALEPPPGWPPGQELSGRARWRSYYELVSHLDAELGRLLASLERLGLRDDTLVVFTSDNGLMLGSHGVDSKGVWHEEATRQPWIARWPGRIAPGRRSPGLASSVDWLPTVRELLGLEPDPALEGRSLLGQLQGGASPRRIVYSVGERHPRDGGGRWWMARSRAAKLVRIDGARTEEHFYDLARDPFELDPLSGAAAFSPAYKLLASSLQRFKLLYASRVPAR